MTTPTPRPPHSAPGRSAPAPASVPAPGERPAPGGTSTPDARTYRPAWQALAVVVAALLIGALANADELARTAELQPLGRRHDAVVELASALRRVADPLRLTAPRRLLESLTGRERPAPGDGTANVAAPTVVATGAERPRPPTATRPLRLAVAGDSVMIALGRAVSERAEATGVVDATVDARFATGLTRPDQFDWPQRLATVIAEQDPDAVMVLFGANDAQGIVTATGPASFGTEAWTAEYRRRVDALMAMLDADGRAVYWLGQPVMRDATLSARMAAINEITRTAAATHPGVRFIDLWPLTADADGGYRAYLPDANGNPVAARADDGVHFSAAGADVVARAVLAAVEADWGIEG